MHSTQEVGQGQDHKTQSQPSHLYVKIGGQTAADAAQALVGNVTEEALLLLLTRGGFRCGVIGLNPFRTAYHVNHGLHVGQGSYAAVATFVQQQFGHALLDAFHNFLAAFLLKVVGFQLGDIFSQSLGGILFQGEGVPAHTDLFCSFHRLRLF